MKTVCSGGSSQEEPERWANGPCTTPNAGAKLLVCFHSTGAGRIASDKGGVQDRNSISGLVSLPPTGNERRAGMDLPFSPVFIESQKRQNVPGKHTLTADKRHGRGDCHYQE